MGAQGGSYEDRLHTVSSSGAVGTLADGTSPRGFKAMSQKKVSTRAYWDDALLKTNS